MAVTTTQQSRGPVRDVRATLMQHGAPVSETGRPITPEELAARNAFKLGVSPLYNDASRAGLVESNLSIGPNGEIETQEEKREREFWEQQVALQSLAYTQDIFNDQMAQYINDQVAALDEERRQLEQQIAQDEEQLATIDEEYQRLGEGISTVDEQITQTDDFIADQQVQRDQTQQELDRTTDAWQEVNRTILRTEDSLSQVSEDIAALEAGLEQRQQEAAQQGAGNNEQNLAAAQAVQILQRQIERAEKEQKELESNVLKDSAGRPVYADEKGEMYHIDEKGEKKYYQGDEQDSLKETRYYSGQSTQDQIDDKRKTIDQMREFQRFYAERAGDASQTQAAQGPVFDANERAAGSAAVIQGLKERRQQYSEELKGLYKQRDDLETNRAALEEKLKRHDEAIAAAQGSKADLEKQRAEMQRQMDELNKRREEIAARVDANKDRVAVIANDAKTLRQLDELRKQDPAKFKEMMSDPEKRRQLLGGLSEQAREDFTTAAMKAKYADDVAAEQRRLQNRATSAQATATAPATASATTTATADAPAAAGQPRPNNGTAAGIEGSSTLTKAAAINPTGAFGAAASGEAATPASNEPAIDPEMARLARHKPQVAALTA